MRFFVHVTLLILAMLASAARAGAQALDDARLDIGSPVLTDLWVDPVSGRDSNSGASQSLALKTVNAAWGKIPSATTLSKGYRINLLPGTYPVDSLPNYWESKYGTAAAPILFSAVNGKESVTWLGSLNVFDVRYFYLDGFQIIPDPVTDVFHCEQCQHVLIRNMTLKTDNVESRNSVKVNQSQYFYIEDSNLEGGYAAGVDFVAVQYGHLIGNNIHGAQDWCHWDKGGSAYITIEGNEFHDCGRGGYTAGQGTGLEFMVSPWLHYEATDIKFVNNIVHDVEGAGVGINGGYNILVSQNTFYHIGTRDHMVEVVYGLRSCDGDSAACAYRLGLGGWGLTATDTSTEPIPDKNIFLYNNVFYNPAGVNAAQLFSIFGPQAPDAGSNIPSPATADADLQIQGNVFWNGGVSTLLGIEDPSQGCQTGNPTCTSSQINSDNLINGAEPLLHDPAAGDYRPISGSPILTTAALSVPAFVGGDRPASPLAPEGNLSNTTAEDFNGIDRGATTIVGAFASAASQSVHPTPTPAPGAQPPVISSPHVSRRSVRIGGIVAFSAKVRSVSAITRVWVTIGARRVSLRKARGTVYKNTWTAAKPKGKRTIVFHAQNRAGRAGVRSSGQIVIN